MVSVMERNLDRPTAVGLALHRMRSVIPVVAISHQEYGSGLGGLMEKADWFPHPLRRVAVCWEG